MLTSPESREAPQRRPSVPDLPRRQNPAPEYINATFLETSNYHLEVCLDQTWTGDKKLRATPGRALLVNTGRDDKI